MSSIASESGGSRRPSGADRARLVGQPECPGVDGAAGFPACGYCSPGCCFADGDAVPATRCLIFGPDGRVGQRLNLRVDRAAGLLADATAVLAASLRTSMLFSPRGVPSPGVMGKVASACTRGSTGGPDFLLKATATLAASLRTRRL